MSRRLLVGLWISAMATLALQAAAAAQTAGFPMRGVVVPGQSIAGVRIGMTESQVAKLWGRNFSVCQGCGHLLTWLFEYPGGEPLGAAVKFSAPAGAASTSSKTPSPSSAGAAVGKVVAVFTLGSPTDWGAKGAMMFDPVSNVYNLFGNPGDAQCVGFTALTVRVGTNTMSFYSANGVIYGFALTASSQSPCQ